MIIGIVVLLVIAMILYGAINLLPWIIGGLLIYKIAVLYIERRYPKKKDE